ncbi:sugar ABC transporter substrate-binding protein [Paenibacillus beijingensis]|uniref:Maltodextrin-binding protein n=1 Tax=Paenibacillus beijingensis TaxID=1126833 RepID=A0A0D5NEY5_9BACL|nr:maltose ABC transporter substrate-binding protein [Paenibacillus beijingensis]AJY73542.1 hypothetical protein VN24_01505 [Paenibacillus beijingensis]
MKLQKMMVALTALVMVFSLAACSQGQESNEPAAEGQQQANAGGSTAAAEEEFKPEEGAKLLVWDAGEQKDFIAEIGKSFKEKYGVEITFADVGADKSMGQMVTDGPAGVGADVFTAVHDRTGSGAQAGIILPNDQFEEETKAESYDTAIQAVSHEDILYGYPRAVETTAVFYNKDLVSQPPATWEEVVTFAKQFNDVKNNKFAYMWDAGSSYFNYGIFGGFGAYLFGANGTDATDIGMNKPEAIEAAKFYQSLTEILPLKSSDINGDIRKSLFAEGKLAMNVSGPWDTGSLKESVKNLGVVPYPALPNGQPMKPFSGVKALYVSAYTKYPNAAKLFARELASAENQKLQYEKFGLLPANKVLAEDAAIKSDPIATGFLKQFENSVPMPSIPEMAQFWAPMDSTLASMWNDKADPQQAMDYMVKQMKDSIASGK